MAQVKITYINSTIDKPERQKRIIKALGLRKLHQSVVHNATPQIEGMIRKVNHLITVEQV